jgi:hypothetical protein
MTICEVRNVAKFDILNYHNKQLKWNDRIHKLCLDLDFNKSPLTRNCPYSIHQLLIDMDFLGHWSGRLGDGDAEDAVLQAGFDSILVDP